MSASSSTGQPGPPIMMVALKKQRPIITGFSQQAAPQVKLHSNLSLNKHNQQRMMFQPSTAHSTTKNKPISVIKTIERQMLALQEGVATATMSHDALDSVDLGSLGITQQQSQPHIRAGHHGGGGPHMTLFDQQMTPERTRKYEGSADRAKNYATVVQQQPFQQYLRGEDTPHLNIRVSIGGKTKEYQGPASRKLRHPSRSGGGNQAAINHMGGVIYSGQSPLYVQDNSVQQLATVAGFQIPHRLQLPSAGTSSLEAGGPKISKQASQLMKMYGNSGNFYHRGKHIKSVERSKVTHHPVVTAAGYTTKHQMYHPHTQQSLSKLSSQEQRMNLASQGGNYILSNSALISKANQTMIYDSCHNLASLDSQRQQQHVQQLQRNLNQSQTYNKFKVKNATLLTSHQSSGEGNSFRKRLSSKNVLRSRYNNNVINPPAQQFNFVEQRGGIQSSSNAHVMQTHHKLNQNNLLLIQQNNEEQLNRSAGEDRFKVMGKNGGVISGKFATSKGQGSLRRLPLRQFNQVENGSNSKSSEMTPGSVGAATDTVMYLKQQEILSKSRGHFEEGKRQLLAKDYKEAIQNFSLSLKVNPNNRDSKYYRAICHLDSEQPRKCIQDLQEIIDAEPAYNKTVYVVQSIAFRRDNDLPSALKALSRGLQKFPRYVEAYQARGQINIYLKKFEKALIDFQHVIHLQPALGAGYIGQADSMKGMGNFKGAVHSYNQALQVDGLCRNQALFKRAVLLYQLKSFEQSLSDFQVLLEDNDKNARAHFYKGKILKKQGLDNEAILHFEQVIKNTNISPNRGGGGGEHNLSSLSLPPPSGGSEELAGNALFEIAKIRIGQRDFYEAFHNLQRALHYDFRSRKFLQYKTFVEGVLFLMKRKVKKGVKLLSALIDGESKRESHSVGPQPIDPPGKQENTSSPPPLKPYVIQLIHIYRSYGLIITQQLDKALADLQKAAKIKQLDQACVYNKFIVQALIKMEKKDLEGVSQILQQAELKFPNNKDPYKYQAICLVQGVINDMVDIDNPKKKQTILDAKAILDRALIKNPKDLNLLYLRGLLLFYLHQFYEALVDIDAVIDLEEEPMAKHYVARGRCHACLSMFQEAIGDLSKAIELDEEISDAYFNRGKCAYLLGDTALAFLDFQKLILLEPKNAMVHIYAGNLLMTTGSYEDATKAFTNADSVQKSPLAFYQRARCNIALANLDQALKDLNVVVERSPQDKIAYVDRECLHALKQTIQATQIAQNEIFSQNLPSTRQGFDPEAFRHATVTYTKLLNTSYGIEQNINSSTTAIRQHQQIIPNVKRIKIEKVRALRRRRVKEETYGGGGGGGMKKSRKVRGTFEVNDSTDHQLRQQAAQIQPFSYYKENIFGQEDFYLYRGVMHFYCGEYLKAINDFEASIKCKQEQKEENQDDTISNASNQTDLSDVGLCSLNVHESQYNIVLALILFKDYPQALERVSQLVHDAPKRYTKGLYLLRGLLYQALGNTSKSKGDLDVVQKLCAQEQGNPNITSQASYVNIYGEYIKSKNPVSINPFPLGTRLCSHYPEVKLTIPQAPTFLYSRPSFSFPFVKPPNMIPNVEESVLNQEFSLKNVGPMKPEAPWIKRCDFGIKFTDEIIQVADLNNGGAVTETEMSTNKDEDDEGRDDSNNDYSDEEEDHGGDDSPSIKKGRRGYKNNVRQVGEGEEEELNERYYLRDYVREQLRRMQRAYSDRLPHLLYNQENDLFGTSQNQEDDEDKNPVYEGENAGDKHRRQSDDDEDEDDCYGSAAGEDLSSHHQERKKDLQQQLRHHLYGETDLVNDDKNIIVDEEDVVDDDNSEDHPGGESKGHPS